MTSYTIADTSAPTYTYTLEIVAPINVSQLYVNNNINLEEEGSPAFNAIFDLAANSIENAYKTLSEFSVQDTNRNRTWFTVALGSGYYDLNTSFTIQNAEVTLIRTVTTDLEGTAKDDFLQAFADNAITEYKSTYNWIDL
jgi:hypothetical protein